MPFSSAVICSSRAAPGTTGTPSGRLWVLRGLQGAELLTDQADATCLVNWALATGVRVTFTVTCQAAVK